ncbi:hypothetical protein IA539_14785 [Gordonia sp. zg691]|nr:hypothetical protein [Gordonia jinghuaiqii]
MDRWYGLRDFFSSIEYWSALQEHLVRDGTIRGSAPLYEAPYFDGDRLLIPRGPGNPEDSDGYTDYSICDEGEYFSIRTTSKSIAGQFDDLQKSWFGRFDDAAKYFLAGEMAFPTRLRMRNAKLEIPYSRWFDCDLAPLWSDVEQPDPRGWVKSRKYFRSDNPSRFYITLNPDIPTSYLLDLTWRQLNSTFTEGIPGIDHVRMPRFSDDS